MKIALVALVVLSTLACERALARSPSNSLAWRQFKQQHEKVYTSQEEDARRFAIFVANKERIELHNANPSASFTMKLNHMSDWTAEEYARLNGARLPDAPLEVMSGEELEQIVGKDAPIPDEIDWRTVDGRVGPVKSQHRCGSCWAFATIGMLEGQELPQNMSSFVQLSDQEIVDCSPTNDHCEGGWPSDALADLATLKIGGIEPESDYPYIGKDEECHQEESKFVPLKVRGFKMLPKGDEKTLKQVVANYGPVAICFDATDDFMHYKGGIFEDESCSKEESDHCVLVVGYGKGANNGEFWIAKNSWSDRWGEQGYFRIKAGSNMCGWANFGTLAIF